MGAAGRRGRRRGLGVSAPPLSVPPPRVDGQPLEYGPAGAGAPEQQLAFLRWTAATGWRYAQTPVDESGDRYRGFLPPRSARVTAAGGALLAGRDLERGAGEQAVALSRDPGDGRFQLIMRHRRTCCCPPMQVSRQRCSSPGDGGPSGRVAVAAYDEDGATAAYFGALGRPVETGSPTTTGPSGGVSRCRCRPAPRRASRSWRSRRPARSRLAAGPPGPSARSRHRPVRALERSGRSALGPAQPGRSPFASAATPLPGSSRSSRCPSKPSP